MPFWVNRQKNNRQNHTRCTYVSLYFMGVFLSIFSYLLTKTHPFSNVLIKVQPHSDIFTPTYLYALTIVHPQFYVH